MSSIKVVTVIGARPQFVKTAMVSKAMAQANEAAGEDRISEILVHTGQHYDDNMSDVFFRELGIPRPEYHLEVGSGSHGRMTGLMLERVEQVLLKEKPDLTLVYGDTNSTLAGALAAVKLHIPVAHVEAGLRSFNMKMPEEVNRILTDRIARWLFCPSQAAVENLRHEGVPEQNMHLVGDVMYDAALHYGQRATPSPQLRQLLGELNGGFCLCTIHRAETTADPECLKGVVRALDTISGQLPVVLPLHPRTRARVSELGIAWKNLKVIDAVGYMDMICLLRDCTAVLTDSGGLQKEAYFFRTPCITLRSETEWVELVDTGANILAGTEAGAITQAWKELPGRAMDFDSKPYGDGDAAGKIVQILLQGAD